MVVKHKPKVFLTRGDIPEEAVNLLTERCEVSVWKEPTPIPRAQLLKNIVGKNALFCTISDRIDKELIEGAGSTFKVVGTMSVGYDHVNVKELKARSIKLGYTPEVLTDAVADLTVGLLLATSRRFFEANGAIRRGKWTSWSPMWMCGSGLKGSTVGIVGFGRIGRAVGKRLQPFGINKFYYTSRERKEYDNEIKAQHINLQNLLKESDFVIITCSLTTSTTKMFDSNSFNMMKPNAILINTSRGEIIDQEALLYALRTKKIAGAGLDVMSPEPLPPNHELLQLDNCVILPHIGSATVRTRTDMAILTAENIISALEGRPMPAEVI